MSEVKVEHREAAQKAAAGTLCGVEWIDGYARGLAVAEHSARESAQGEGWATPAVLAALRLAQRATCTYFGPTCDCKYGASGKGEQTGCPELRTLIAKAEAALPPPPKAEGKP